MSVGGGSKFSVSPGPCTSERRLGASAVLKVFCDRATSIISSSTAGTTEAPRSTRQPSRLYAVVGVAITTTLLRTMRSAGADTTDATCAELNYSKDP